MEFPSYEDAVRDAGGPETDRDFREMAALCDEAPVFMDLDVVRADRPAEDTVRRFFTTLAAPGELSPLNDLLDEDVHRPRSGEPAGHRWTWRATHQGDFLGIAPTGRHVTMPGITLFRFALDGKIAETWWQHDQLGLMEQLGALEELER